MYNNDAILIISSYAIIGEVQERSQERILSCPTLLGGQDMYLY